MKVEFEIDQEGNFKASGSVLQKLNGKNFTVSGKIALDEDEERLYETMRKFFKELECYCPAEFNYNSNSPSK